MQIGDNLHEKSNPVFWENKKMSSSSAELTQRVVKWYSRALKQDILGLYFLCFFLLLKTCQLDLDMVSPYLNRTRHLKYKSASKKVFREKKNVFLHKSR